MRKTMNSESRPMPAAPMDHDVRGAIRTAIQRCPEHAEVLARLNEAHFAMRLYSDAYTQIKKQYRELASEHMKLQQEHTEVHIKAAMIADFLGYMSRRLQGPVETLEELSEKVSAVLSERDEETAKVLLHNVVRLMHIISDLIQVAEVMRNHRTPTIEKATDGISYPATNVGSHLVEAAQPAVSA